MHQNLEAAFRWSDGCDLPLNASKSSHVSIGGHPPLPSDSFRRNGNIGGGLHERPRSYRDLDFQNIPSLSTSSKSRPAYPVPASSWFCSLDTRDIPTPDLVRPFLEYSLQASSPYLRRDINLMEHIQRLATRIVKGMRELPYEDQLCRSNIDSFKRCWLCGDLILAASTVALT